LWMRFLQSIEKWVRAYWKVFMNPVSLRNFKKETFRLDLMVEDKVVIEVKAVETLLPIHEAQLLTYLKLTGCEIGLLINFNVRLIRDGIRRVVLSKKIKK
jgi:GxxExxY protein